MASGCSSLKTQLAQQDHVRHLQLYGAALLGDWETAKRIIEADSNALNAIINRDGENVLQVAAKGCNSLHFVRELVKMMDAKSLEQTPPNTSTALYIAAKYGKTEVAKILVEKNPNLTQIRNSIDDVPLHAASNLNYKDTFLYLLSVTKDEYPSPFRDGAGVRLLSYLINTGLYGIALNILKQYPILAEAEELQVHTIQTLSKKPYDFQSGIHLRFLQCLIYHYIPVEEEKLHVYPTKHGDLENRIESSKEGLRTTFGTSMHKNMYIMLWSLIKRLVPSINHIHDIKIKHSQTLQLVKLMCTELSSRNYERAIQILPLFTTTELGIHEFVEEIIKTCAPKALFIDRHGRNILEVAVLHRRHKVFNLICQMGFHELLIVYLKHDNERNNILHLAGMLNPSSQISGAALQMQRELKWFQCVENLALQSMKEAENNDGKTPKELFTESHKNLLKEGEEWTKGIATSCTVVGSLIATVVFASAITVPGGNNDKGAPNFLYEPSFLIFWIADAVALFSSTTSVMMFLIMLISRYSEQDFIKSVPNKLIISLLTLFISIASMMIAFGATLHIVFVDRWSKVVIPIVLLSGLPVTLFAYYMFPLLVELIVSTYGRGIFEPIKR